MSIKGENQGPEVKREGDASSKAYLAKDTLFTGEI